MCGGASDEDKQETSVPAYLKRILEPILMIPSGMRMYAELLQLKQAVQAIRDGRRNLWRDGSGSITATR